MTTGGRIAPRPTIVLPGSETGNRKTIFLQPLEWVTFAARHRAALLFPIVGRRLQVLRRRVPASCASHPEKRKTKFVCVGVNFVNFMLKRVGRTRRKKGGVGVNFVNLFIFKKGGVGVNFVNLFIFAARAAA